MDKALKEAQRGREINPEYGLAHYIEGLVLYHSGKLKEAAAAFQKTLILIPARGTPTKTEVNTALAFTRHALGDYKWSLKLKDRVFRSIDPFSLGLLQTLNGERDEAFKTLSGVKDWTSFSTEIIRYFYPQVLSPLRKDSRYQELMHTVNSAWGFPEDQ